MFVPFNNGNSGIYISELKNSGNTTNAQSAILQLNVEDYSTLTIGSYYGYACRFIFTDVDTSTKLRQIDRTTATVITNFEPLDISSVKNLKIELANPASGYWGTNGYIKDLNIF